MVNIDFLTPFQITTFVLGIVFSILTIAMVFYTLRHENGYRNTFIKVLFTLILPMITFIMWFACAFAAYAIFDSSELYIMLLSIACGAALSGLSYLIAWLISKYAVKKTTVDSKIEIYAINRIEKKIEKDSNIKSEQTEENKEDKENQTEQAEIIEETAKEENVEDKENENNQKENKDEEIK